MLTRAAAVLAVVCSIGCSRGGQSGTGGAGRGGNPGGGNPVGGNGGNPVGGSGGSSSVAGNGGSHTDAGTGGTAANADAGNGGAAGHADGGNPAALIATEFVSYHSATFFDQPCTTGCSSSLDIGANGNISNSAGASATLSDDDLRTFASWAVSQEHIDALQAHACGQVADGGVSVIVEIRPGIFVNGANVAGCLGGPIGAVEMLANHLASEYLSGGSPPSPSDPQIAHPELTAKIDWSKLTFQDLQLRSSGTSPAGEIGADGTIYGPGTTSGPKLDAATLAELERQATSLDLVAAWPGTCAPASDTDELQVFLSTGVLLQTGTQGCTDGPVTALENLLISAVQSLP